MRGLVRSYVTLAIPPLAGGFRNGPDQPRDGDDRWAGRNTHSRGLSPGGPDNDCWNIVALGSVVPPLSEGVVIGKIEKYNRVHLPREVLAEPLGLGTPGAYVARVASRVLTSEELEKLKGLEEASIWKWAKTYPLDTPSRLGGLPPR
jgi:hypothetical protein